MEIKGLRSDLKIETSEECKSICLTFKNLQNQPKIKKELKEVIKHLLKEENLPSQIHFFVVGLGNDNFTSDSIGPKVLKNLYVNAFVNQLGLDLHENKISALEPGALIETGIDTAKIIKSVVKSIKPDILICLDAFVCSSTKYLNHSIELSNTGIIPGSGLKGINQEISQKNIGIPVLTIGVPTAIELTLDEKTYLLSTKDIDTYVENIAKLIGDVLNELLPTYGLK